MENINNLQLSCNSCNVNKDCATGKKEENYIKVNLPSTQEDYESGRGEGCWFTVTDEVYKDYENDRTSGNFVGTLENDSFYYQGLMCGKECPIEFRGKNRPVVPLKWLNENYGQSIWK